MVNVTVPVGVPRDPASVTTAVKVTCWPTVDGFNDDVSVVIVACEFAAFTVCVGSDPLLGLTFVSPLYAAETECGPTVRVEVGNFAWSTPPTTESGTGVSDWPSIVKVTDPVGVPWNPAAVTTAVNVTRSPTVDGFNEDDTIVTVAGRACDPTAFENAEVFPIESVAVAV
jgi:hypothetical protein